MPNRTHREDMVFRQPFLLKGWSEPLPAGTYAVETEEELIEGLSFPAYRRVSTTITRQAARARALVQAIAVDPREVAVARRLPTGGAGPAHSLMLTVDRKMAWVNVAGNDSLAVLDLATGEVADQVKTGKYP